MSFIEFDEEPEIEIVEVPKQEKSAKARDFASIKCCKCEGKGYTG
jgi:hypothetical protein